MRPELDRLYLIEQQLLRYSRCPCRPRTWHLRQLLDGELAADDASPAAALPRAASWRAGSSCGASCARLHTRLYGGWWGWLRRCWAGVALRRSRRRSKGIFQRFPAATAFQQWPTGLCLYPTNNCFLCSTKPNSENLPSTAGGYQRLARGPIRGPPRGPGPARRAGHDPLRD